MKYYLFIDETGDHDLSNIDDDFPIFLIGAVLISEKEYKIIKNNINTFKEEFFNTEDIILHSNDIRKINPPFQILFDLKIKERFYNKLNKIIKESKFSIIPVGINKKKLIEKYGKASENPYALSVNFLIERLVFCCDKINDCSEVEIIIESRGKKEDAELWTVLQKIKTRGTSYISSKRINSLITKINFKKKQENDIGLQISDLVSYPIAKKELSREIINPAYEIIKDKIKRKEIKIFP